MKSQKNNNQKQKLAIKGRRLAPDEVLAEKKHFEMLMIHYGDMIKEKNRAVLQMYYREDHSLSEIAEEIGITRQGVQNTIRRCIFKMDQAEVQLGLIARDEAIKRDITYIIKRLAEVQDSGAADVSDIIGRAKKLIED